MLVCARTLGKVSFVQCANEEFSTKRHRPKKTNKQKHTQHTHAEVVATYLHFSPSVVSEHFHQFAATKANLCKISRFFSLTRKANINLN